MSWTEERVALLRKLWDAGLSCSQISTELACGLTRNAVIGKVRRMGISGRAPKVAKPAALAPRARGPRQRPTDPFVARPAAPLPASMTDALDRAPAARMRALPLPDDISAPDASTRITILDLTESRCKWPLGDPETPGFSYCGSAKDVAAGPYCPFHFKIAYTTQGQKRISADAHRVAIAAGKREAERLRRAEAAP